ncbi:uncharacterized protein LOC109409039 [Aedes albopictus]|uniref:DUF4806 domain-containing protein n=1 Tax=Aedes albopictus TaxID=7160 RepID=A0ABM1YHR2_AEDAL
MALHILKLCRIWITQVYRMEQTDTITDLDALIKKNIVDAVNEIVPIAIEKYLDANIDRVVERAVSAAVDKSFAMNFARLTAMTGVMKNTETEVDVRAEQHALIDTEKQLDDWNTDLAQDAVRKKYMEYFSKIIVPNSYLEKGDDAFYIISDCLFTRRFWNRFTWTGVNRGGKSERGFREFGNVTELLLSLVQVGDPMYTRLLLEKFCKTRLFRHAKSRSTNKMLRKSSCRTKRSGKKKQTEKDVTDGVPDTRSAATMHSDDEDMGEFENASSGEKKNEISDDESIGQESIVSSSDSSC